MHGRVFFLFWAENYQVVYLINVTRLSKRNPADILSVKEKYQVSNTKSVEWASLFPQPNTTHLDTMRALISIIQTQYEMKHMSSFSNFPQVTSQLPSSNLNSPFKAETIN